MTLNPFALPPIPSEFWRITDDQTFINFDSEQGFNCLTSTQCMSFNQRITPWSVRDHLENGRQCEWKGLISLAGTFEKARKEIQWRLSKYKRRHNVLAYKISTSGLKWATIPWNEEEGITFKYLIDEDETVMIFKATDLIQQLGLSDCLELKIKIAAKDEWLALEWIPRPMIERRWQQTDGHGRVCS